jgi:uncharacterized damage-inducible protein DinB
MARPQHTEHGSFYQRYIDLATGNSVQEVINNHFSNIAQFINNLPEEKANYAYAENKWTVKQVLQHLIDAERIFVYRALTISRKDDIPLPGFDENSYAANATAAHRTLSDLKQELLALRNSTDVFLLTLTDEELQQRGTANGHGITVNAIAYITIGHLLHHIQVLQERYL